MHQWAARAALIGLLSLRQAGVEPHVHSTAAVESGHEMSELWQKPADLAGRNLVVGSTAGVPAPVTDQPMTMLSQKTSGFSAGYDVRDAAGHEWSVKLGDEAQTEVVASRLVWAIGFHQPPTFYVSAWALADGPSPGPQPPARFRPKDDGLDNVGVWSWHHDPFAGTLPYQGLLATMLLLNSTDLKTENNIVYRVNEDGRDEMWYVVRDLGATLGETGVYRPRRNDVDAFEASPFLVSHADDGSLKFGFQGLQRELLRDVDAPALRWMADLFGQLSDRQWHDAFRAGGYDEATASRYITALKDRVAAAASIDPSFDGDDSDYWAGRTFPRVLHAIKQIPHAVGDLFH
ncbi:MAG TPA: hypothetical protein VL173_17330 [Vicinamibacterales bacterium]|nr:hypothetical protein [Vicinamibacterales bacterium]